MAKVEQQKYLFSPPYSEEVETHIIPIAKHDPVVVCTWLSPAPDPGPIQYSTWNGKSVGR